MKPGGAQDAPGVTTVRSTTPPVPGPTSPPPTACLRNPVSSTDTIHDSVTREEWLEKRLSEAPVLTDERADEILELTGLK